MNSQEAINELDAVIAGCMLPETEKSKPPHLVHIRQEFENLTEAGDFIIDHFGFRDVSKEESGGARVFAHERLPMLLSFSFGKNTMYVDFCFLSGQPRMLEWFGLEPNNVLRSRREVVGESLPARIKNFAGSRYKWQGAGIVSFNRNAKAVLDTKLKKNVLRRMSMVLKSRSAAMMGEAAVLWWKKNKDVFTKEETLVGQTMANFNACTEAEVPVRMGFYFDRTTASNALSLKINIAGFNYNHSSEKSLYASMATKAALFKKAADVVESFDFEAAKMVDISSRREMKFIISADRQDLHRLSVEMLLVFTEDNEVLVKEGLEIINNLLTEK